MLFDFTSIPELAYVPPEERARIWKRAVESAKPKAESWFVLGFFVLMSVMTRMAGNVFGIGRWGAWRWTLDVGVSAFLGLALGTVLLNYQYRKAREYLRAELRARGRCAYCGYDLRETPDRCPECGKFVYEDRN